MSRRARTLTEQSVRGEVICLDTKYARVAELVDALASGASVSNDVEVQVLSRAPQ